MPAYNIQWKKSVTKELTDIPKEYSTKIFNEISNLSEIPRPDGCRKLKGTNNIYRIKINEYRVIYSIEDNILTIEIIRIAHRKEAYRNLN